MPYQIKSTPFFQRMISKSKKNGQLQRLKEEYERIKEFDERAIELKMRQVRLKRLFREIEEIKETSAAMTWKRRRLVPEREKSDREVRIAALLKAKRLGTEYSKMNAIIVDRMEGGWSSRPSSSTATYSKSRIDTKRKALSFKRVTYGNEISKCNMQNLNSEKTRKKSSKSELKSDSSTKQSYNRLKKRLNYGNSRSNDNMFKVPKRNKKHKIANEQVLGQAHSQLSSEAVHEELQGECTLATDETQVFKSFEELQESRDFFNNFTNQLHDDFEEYNLARERWRKIADAVHNRSEAVKAHTLISTKQVEYEQEYQLRNISNDTDLPSSQLNIKHESIYYDNIEDPMPEEFLIHIERYQEDATNHLETMASASSLPPPVELSEELSAPSPKVKQFVKLFEPAENSLAMQKQPVDLGFQKLRSVFEHQSD